MCLGFRFCSVVLLVIWLDEKEIQLSQSDLFIFLHYEDVCVLVGCNWRRQTCRLFSKIIEQGFTGAARWLLPSSPSWLGAPLMLVGTWQPPLSCMGEGDGAGYGRGVCCHSMRPPCAEQDVGLVVQVFKTACACLFQRCWAVPHAPGKSLQTWIKPAAFFPFWDLGEVSSPWAVPREWGVVVDSGGLGVGGHEPWWRWGGGNAWGDVWLPATVPAVQGSAAGGSGLLSLCLSPRWCIACNAEVFAWRMVLM